MASGLSTLLKLGTDISQLATGLNQSKELISSFAGTIKGVMDTVVQTVQRAIQSLVQLGKQIMALGTASARLDSMRDSFNKMTAEFGASGQELLRVMNEATLGMARDSELISNSMTAMMLINKEAMGDVTKTLPMFAKIATAASRALGTSVEYMFGSIARGVGRASPMILDNLGMIIKLTDVYDGFAQELGKTRKELTTVEKQTALVNEVMRQGSGYVKNLGISTGGLATKQKQLTKLMVDFNDTMGQAVMPMVQALQGLWTDVANTIITRVVPAFRTLGRVLSEVFGTKNPFERWIQGDPIGKTAKRIRDLEAGFERLKAAGADFAGGVTDANERFEEAVGKLGESFGVKFAKIQSDLTERIRDIWSDFHFRQARKDEDDRREDIRRAEEHKERLIEIENRYDDQITDAIRNRDARALLNIMRQQDKEKKSVEKQFVDDQKRREEDRELERKRDEEDAQKREEVARESAAKQYAAVNAEFEKAAAELEKIRQEEIDTAQKAYEAAFKDYEDQIQKQKELIIQQMLEEEKLRAEMSKPLPPIWEKVSTVLTIVWGKLQKIRDAIVSIVENPSLSNIMEQLGIDPEILSSVSTTLGEIKTWLFEVKEEAIKLWESFLEIAGPEFVTMWEDLKLAFEELKPYWPEIIELGKMLAEILGGVLLLALISVVASLRLLSSVSVDAARTLGRLAKGITDIWEGIKKAWISGFKILKGIMTRDVDLIVEGWEERWEAIKLIFGGVWESIEAIIEGAFTAIIQGTWAFIETFIDIFERLAQRLVGGSVIPEMFDDILSVLDSFIVNALQKWSDGWNGFVTVVQNIWTTISTIISGFTTSIGTMVGGWATNIANVVQRASQPAPRVITGNTGYRAWQSNTSADNWNIYGGGGQAEDIANQVHEVIIDVFGSSNLMDKWRRR